MRSARGAATSTARTCARGCSGSSTTTRSTRRGAVSARRDAEPLEEGDHYLYNRLDQGLRGGQADIERLIDQLSQGPVMDALADLPQNFKEVACSSTWCDFSYQEAADILEHPDRHRDEPAAPGSPRAQDRLASRRALAIEGGSLTCTRSTSDCREAEQRLQAYVDRALTSEEVAAHRGAPGGVRAVRPLLPARDPHACDDPQGVRGAVPRGAQGAAAQPLRRVRLRRVVCPA